MIGDWVAKSAGDSNISWQCTCDWTANRRFSIRKFNVEGTASPIQSSTEVIGWDPRGQTIFSWTFDRDGAFGESIWIRDGEHWIARYTGVTADGDDRTLTQVLTWVNVNSANLRFIDREVDGVKRPDTAEIQINRTVGQQSAKSQPARSEQSPRQKLP